MSFTTNTKGRAAPETLVASAKQLSTNFSTEAFSLVVLDGPHKGQELAIDRELIRIGRMDWCDLVLSEDQWVSNLHCECWLDEKGFQIRDLGSRNGVLMNGCRLMNAYLVEGAQFKIGNSTIELKSHKKKRKIPVSFQDESGSLVGKSPSMRKIFSMLSRLGARNVSTLLGGETGTGKTSIAHAIHEQSVNPDAPFVVVNCGALPASLIESALFGYEKGAYTGATSRHQGFFQQAHGGTLFLDEIAELPLELQPKLLDVLERRKIRRLGSEREYDVDFRLITATHRHLPDEIEKGQFREDLYFRISVVELEVPPLRERPEDIPLLAERLLQKMAPDDNFKLSEEAFQLLQTHLWPGNVRELHNAIERSIIFLDGKTIEAEDLEPALGVGGKRTKTPATGIRVPEGDGAIDSPLFQLLPTFPLKENQGNFSLKPALEELEKEIIIQALEETKRNAKEASLLLDISPAWLYNRLKKYKISTKYKQRD